MNATMTTPANGVFNTLAAPNVELLGEIVSWDTRSPELGIDVIRNALSTAGLPDDVAKDLNSRSAFTRATKHLKENRSIDKVKEGKDGCVRFQLTRKELEDDHIVFQEECWVTINTTTGEIESDNAAIEMQARALFAHAMQVRTASDITRMVQALFKAEADLFAINPSKGVAYFCPEQHREFTAKVEVFLSAVGGSLWRFPVPKGTKEGNKSVQEAVSSGLQTVLDELNECVNSWDDKTKNGTMEKVIKRWQLLEHKAKTYGEYLQSEQGNLLYKIDEAKALLISKLKEVRPSDASAAA